MSHNPNRGLQYLNGNYVYYIGLRSTNFYPNLISQVDTRFKQTIEETSNLQRLSDYFLSAASTELTKEQAILQQKFGQTIKGSYSDKNFAKRLVESINTCLGIKEVFERNLALIIESNGQKNVMSWFPTYFQQAWEAVSTEVWNQVITDFTNQDLTPEEALKAAVDFYLPEIVRDALQRAFAAGVETGISIDRDKYSDAYKQISEALRSNARGSNEFIQAFITNYHLNEIVQNLEQEDSSQIQSFLRTGKNFNIKSNIHQRGGLTMEAFRTYIFNLIGESINAAGGEMHPKVQGLQTGSTGQKADVIASIDIPINIIEQWIEENDFGNRQKNVQAMKQLQEKLKEFTDGFVTFVNSKNYTLNANFENGIGGHLGGFSAGDPISLENFQAAAQILDVNYDNLVHSCLQLVPGAIGQDSGNEIRLALTKAIASALFDDFNMVGVETTVPGAQAIHLLDLNGVLLPISFYFQMLGEAFGLAASEMSSNPEALIGVEIMTPGEVIYGQTEPAPYGQSEAHWNHQSEQAMKNIKIKWHFLSGFRTIMSQVMN